MKTHRTLSLILILLSLAGCDSTNDTLQTHQPPASLDPFVAEEITNLDRPNPTRAKTQELFARASDLPTGPQEVLFYARRQENLDLLSKWSGISRTDLAETNGLPDSDKELPVNTPVTISLTADQLDRFEDARDRYHETYQAAFYAKHTVVELTHHTIERGDSLWKLSRTGEIRVPLWLMAKVNPGTDLSVLSVGDTVKIPVLAPNTNPAGNQKQALLPPTKQNLPEIWPTPAPQPVPAAKLRTSDVKAPVLGNRQVASAPVAPAVVPEKPAETKKEIVTKEENVAEVVIPKASTPSPKINIKKAPVIVKNESREPISIKVQKGESLSHYASWGHVSLQAIMGANALANADRVRLGQTLLIPVEKERVEGFFAKREQHLTSKGATAADVASHSTPPWKTHKVVTGESAWLIAVRQYGISVEELASSNPDINLERLQPGMKLRVPTQ